MIEKIALKAKTMRSAVNLLHKNELEAMQDAHRAIRMYKFDRATNPSAAGQFFKQKAEEEVGKFNKIRSSRLALQDGMASRGVKPPKFKHETVRSIKRDAANRAVWGDLAVNLAGIALATGVMYAGSKKLSGSNPYMKSMKSRRLKSLLALGGLAGAGVLGASTLANKDGIIKHAFQVGFENGMREIVGE